MPDYKNGKIYKLWSPQGDEIYIGSTTQSLARRKALHKARMNCCSKLLFEKYDDVRIELIEEFPCENKMELNKREGQHMRNNTCINKYIAGRTIKEYHEDNKEKIKQYLEDNKEKIKEQMKEYHQNNKEKIKERKKEWHEDNKEKIKEYEKEYYENNKEKIKQYCEDNKEKILEYQKDYRENNKEKIKECKKEYGSKKVMCECGCEVRRDWLSKHKRSIKHINFINQ